MKLYHHLTQCRFLYRVNRFIAHCEIGGTDTVVHVKNTGRLGELLLPDATVWCEAASNPSRKTAWDLVAVENRGYVVNIDSQAANQIAREWIEGGHWCESVTSLSSEYTHGDSRFDFTYLHQGRRGLIEVKGVTLFDDDCAAFFPDAPTERGVKHLAGLTNAALSGTEAGVLFVLQRDDVRQLHPNNATHPAFGEALRRARDAGVRIEAGVCHVTPDSCRITHTVPVIL